jgi:excinuclease ABC subunit B
VIENTPPPHGAAAGERPRLLDYLPDDFLYHRRIARPSQLGGMYEGDRSRKKPSWTTGFGFLALDNRPLRFDEFMALVPRMLFVSATPGDQELQLSEGVVVEQIIRPTGLVDPEVEVRPVKGQVDDLLREIRERARAGERVLVTTLTKRMSEDLTDYLQQHGVRVRYLHSEIDAIERVEIIGACAWVNSTFWSASICCGRARFAGGVARGGPRRRPEGFLRSDRSLIQTVGRAARNSTGGLSCMPTG